MKFTTFFFTALVACAVKIGQICTLQIYTMDTWETQIDIKDPSWGDLSSGLLKSHAGDSYKTNRNKTLILSAPRGYGILAAIRLLDLRPNSQDKLTLFAVNGIEKPFTYSNAHSFQWKMYDDFENKNTFYASNGQLGVTFDTGPYFSTVGYLGFELIFTVQGDWTKCKFADFRCRNGRCISNFLKCDGHNHCGDRSDQNNCYYPVHTRSGRLVGIVGGVVFLVIAVACAIFIVVRRATRSKTERQTIIQHPPTNLPGYPPYPEQGTYYPPPPPPYSPYNQGVANPGYH